MLIVISFDIDGTLEAGDPPGPVTMDMVRAAQRQGFIIGSCSWSLVGKQRDLWERHRIPVHFAVRKPDLSRVRAKFHYADRFIHIGDSDRNDRRNALKNGFEHLWPDEAAAHPWFRTRPQCEEDK